MSTIAEQEAGRAALVRLSRAEPLIIAARSFIFVRHGETQGNRTRIYQPADEPLNENGLAQARTASTALRGQRVRKIVGSTMIRAWRTAEIIAEPHELTPQPTDRLRERWFGSLVGTPSTHIDWGYNPPGGEKLIDFVARTRAGFVEALQEAEGTIVVAHGGNLHVLANGLGLSLSPELGANASPIQFVRDNDGWAARPVGHLNPLIGIAS